VSGSHVEGLRAVPTSREVNPADDSAVARTSATFGVVMGDQYGFHLVIYTVAAVVESAVPSEHRPLE
jgi:hypothetical protein